MQWKIQITNAFPKSRTKQHAIDLQMIESLLHRSPAIIANFRSHKLHPFECHRGRTLASVISLPYDLWRRCLWQWHLLARIRQL
jgi:hypothetical protein